MHLWPRTKSLQRKITGFILVISFFLLVLSVFIVDMAWENYQKARSLAQTGSVSQELTQSIRGLAFERGRINVALRSEQPIKREDMTFVEERRHLADTHLANAMQQLEATHPAVAHDLKIKFELLTVARRQVDAEVRKVYADRDSRMALFWLRQSTDFISQVENTLRYVSKQHIDSSKFFLYHQLMLDSLRFRLTAGYHATVLTTALSRPDKTYVRQYEELTFLKNQADSLWADLEMQVADLSNSEIAHAKEQVFVRYYKEYRPEQEMLIAFDQWTQVDPGSIAHLQKLSVRALDSIFLLTDAAEAQVQEYVSGMLTEAKWQLVAGIAQFIACLLLVAFCISYFERQLFRPLRRISQALEQIGSDGEVCILSKEIDRQDEIGQIGRGVQRLQESIVGERRLTAENEQLAMTDFLTGCLNKRGFYLRAEAEISRAKRDEGSVSFVFADLDNLKMINDVHGHLVGDEAVKHFAECVMSQCRSYDVVGRFGGDEFVFCFPATDEAQAFVIVNRIRDCLELSELSVRSSQDTIRLSASFGIVASVPGEDQDADWFIQQADMALYQAKQSGKNCAMITSGETKEC